MQAAPAQDLYIVLKPTLHPELGEIRIDSDLFAIGRDEPPFAGYDRALVAEMSRRHARIFIDRGVAYVADLDSKNGTAVNGAPVRQKPRRLRAGDVVSFGGELSYEVALGMHVRPGRQALRLISLTLVPARDDLGLQPVVVSRFPFLVSKADEVFARYREAYPHQVNYVSRRHAHIFLKDGAPFVEDLGSTNGTFVDGRRLDEHAVALADGTVLGFGGRHFVYRVGLQFESTAEQTRTRYAAVDGADGLAPAEADKTTFVAAADSFLDIFCVDAAPVQEDELNQEVAEAESAAAQEAAPAPSQSRRAAMLAALADALGGDDAGERRRYGRWAAALAAAVAVIAGGLYLQGAPERELAALMDSGDYAGAAALAHQRLAAQPQDKALATLATDALLKARLPDWLARLRAGDQAGAAAVLADMRTLAAANEEARGLAGELEWMGELEGFVAERGGVDAPIRIFRDEARIRDLVGRWRADTRGHQRAYARIAAQVPAFSDQYARTLSLLRKLESDEAVYLAAIERLQAALEAGRDNLDAAAVDSLLREYAERYPRLAGLDELRRRYRPAAGVAEGAP